MIDLKEQINSEVVRYVECCRAAAKHDNNEKSLREEAHLIFYRIQEMRSTGRLYDLAR